jgi:hypothetical protein
MATFRLRLDLSAALRACKKFCVNTIQYGQKRSKGDSSSIRLRRIGTVSTLLTTIVLVVAYSFSSTSVAAEPQARAQALAHAVQVHRQHAFRLLALKDVVGTATGMDRNGSFVVKVYAMKAKVAGIPQKLNDVPVVIEATGPFFALQQPEGRKRERPGDRDMREWPDRHGMREQPGKHGLREWPRERRPFVMIVSPKEDEIVSGDVTITALTFDRQGVNSVQFFVDGTSLGTDADGSDGWSITWDTTQVADGQHRLSAVATDEDNDSGKDRVNVTVSNGTELLSPDGRPSPIGVSTGNANEDSAGTIGCRVMDALGNVYALSNNHVYARTDQASIGESIVQPGLFDTNGRIAYSDQVIGQLFDFVTIDFSPNANNKIDAAIALSTTANLGNSTPKNGYGKPKSQPVAASVGQAVQKYGAVSLLTTGQVSGIDAVVTVNYGSESAVFTGQIIVGGPQNFILPGDSGSLLVTASQQSGDAGRDPVGLLFAGSADGSNAIANPIQTVLDAFGVTIDGE